MTPYTLPPILTSQDLEALLDVGRARLSRLRSEDAAFPDPVPTLSTPRKPRWMRADVLRWMVLDRRLPIDVLEPFEVIDASGPVSQRWQLVGAEFVSVTGLRRPTELRVLRYDAINPEDPRKVALCVPVGDVETDAVGNYMPAEALTQLDYGDNRGAVAWIAPAPGTGDYAGTVFGTTVEDDQQSLSMRLIQPVTLARLLGHRLPFWQRGGVSKAAASTWTPQLDPDNPAPVLAGPVPALASAKRFREQCAEVIAQIAAGEREAPEEAPAQLAQMGNTMWDLKLSRFDWDDQPIEVGPGWILPIIPPVPSTEETEPLLPVQPAAVDLFEGLEWLLGQENLPEGMAQTGTGFFGYPQSVEVIELDLAALPAQLRTLLDDAFVPIERRNSWLHTALYRRLGDSATELNPAPVGWKSDPAPETHPGLLVGDRRIYHVPRKTLPVGTSSAVHLVATGTGDERRFSAFLVGRGGAISPIAINTHSTTGEIACVLTAVALEFDEPLLLTRRPKLRRPPELLVRMTEAMASTDHLEIDWDTLLHAVGPRPDGISDRDLAMKLNDRPNRV